MNWYKTTIKSNQRQKYIERFGQAWINTPRPHSATLYIKEWTKPPIDKSEIDILYFSPECIDTPLIKAMMIELNCMACETPDTTDLFCPYISNS